MKHSYHHTFRNNRKIRLVVDFSGSELKMIGDRVPIECADEYQHWKMTVVLPDVMNRMSPEQCANAMLKGVKASTK